MSSYPLNTDAINLASAGEKFVSGHAGAIYFREARTGATLDGEGRLLGGVSAPDAQIYIRFGDDPWVALYPGEAIRYLTRPDRLKLWWPAQADTRAMILMADAEQFEAVFRTKAL